MATPSPQRSTINVLLTSFPGLGLPSTLCIPVPSTSTVAELTALLYDRLASSLRNQRLILTTTSNKALSATSPQPLSSLLNALGSTTNVDNTSLVSAQYGSTAANQPQLLTLRLSAPLCGGKGGFGSQLRAAGGRMSSRKKRGANAEAAIGSNRNLEGRRLRTVAEAKALAEYLALKPEMEKKEKEERRKKWEAVVEASERRQEEILSGKAGAGKGRGDAEWLERKEEAEAKVREAVEKAVRDGLLVQSAAAGVGAGLVNMVMDEGGKVQGGESDEDEDGDEEMSSEKDAGEGPSGSSEATTPEEAPQRKIFGWDEDDEDEQDEEDEEDDNQQDD